MGSTHHHSRAKLYSSRRRREITLTYIIEATRSTHHLVRNTMTPHRCNTEETIQDREQNVVNWSRFHPRSSITT